MAVALFILGSVWAAGGGGGAVHVNIAQKSARDTLSAAEFNQLVQVLRSIHNVSGKIGIGITPSQKLHVSGDILATGKLLAPNLTTQCPINKVMRGFTPSGDLSCVEKAGGGGK